MYGNFADSHHPICPFALDWSLPVQANRGVLKTHSLALRRSQPEVEPASSGLLHGCAVSEGVEDVAGAMIPGAACLLLAPGLGTVQGIVYMLLHHLRLLGCSLPGCKHWQPSIVFKQLAAPCKGAGIGVCKHYTQRVYVR